MEIAELLNKLVENQQEFGDIWESLDTDIKEALEKERPETLEKLGEWHNVNNDLIYKISSIVNDMFITKYAIGIIMIDTLLTSTIRYITRTY